MWRKHSYPPLIASSMASIFESRLLSVQFLVPNLLKLYVNREFTGSHTQVRALESWLMNTRRKSYNCWELDLMLQVWASLLRFICSCWDKMLDCLSLLTLLLVIHVIMKQMSVSSIRACNKNNSMNAQSLFDLFRQNWIMREWEWESEIQIQLLVRRMLWGWLRSWLINLEAWNKLLVLKLCPFVHICCR